MPFTTTPSRADVTAAIRAQAAEAARKASELVDYADNLDAMTDEAWDGTMGSEYSASGFVMQIEDHVRSQLTMQDGSLYNLRRALLGQVVSHQRNA